MKILYKNPFLIFSLQIFMILVSFSITSQENVSSQQLDNRYLDSLPESVREDIEKQMEENNQSKNISMESRPSSELLKLELVRDWENFKRKNDKPKSERYGLNIFRSMQTTFMPLSEPNFGNNYILDYGDVINIQAYGSSNSSDNQSYSEEIKRDGSIYLKDIGSVNLAGLNYEQAIETIKNKYETVFIGVNVVINLEKIRDIIVLLTGEVEFPGVYTLSGNSNVLQALNFAGGITDNGSLRQVEVKRNGKVINTIDLYSSLLFGDISGLDNLQSGDAIFIKPVKKLARAGSGFNKQYLFEMLENENLSDLINFAGGINASVAQKSYTLIRNQNGAQVLKNIPESDLSTIKVENLDSLYLMINNYGSVEISGEVKRPGIYTITNNDDIYDLILRAGGYTESAYSFGGMLINQQSKDLEKKYIEKTYQSIISYMVENPGSIQAGGGIISILDQIKNIEPSGRVVAQFDMVELELNPVNRLILNDKDKIVIPKKTKNIYVFGDVSNPGTMSFDENKTLNDYINNAGGFLQTADKRSVVVVNPNGDAFIYKHSRILSIVDNQNDIYPGTLIYIPRDIGRLDGIQLTSTFAPIFSSLALSLASLNSISD